MEGGFHRRPVWQPSELSRLISFLRGVPNHVTLSRVVLVFFVLPVLFYIYREVTRDALIVDPFTVPKRFEESGLTSQVISNRIGDALRQIETATRTQMKKDKLASLRDEGAVPDVEIPGTRVGLKTVVEMARAIFGIYPKHVSGDIVIIANAESQATVTFYVTKGRNRSQAITLAVSTVDIGSLAQRTAEMVLGQVNPYVLAAYRDDHQEFEKAVEIVQRIAENPPEDCAHISAAFALWSNLFHRQKKEECISISAAYNLWGVVLDDEKNYDGEVAKYQKAIEFNPKNALAYYNWGVVLNRGKNYAGAVAKYQKAIELDPKDADAYFNWGVVLSEQENYDGAVAKYQKAIELYPKSADAYFNWGVVLSEQENYDGAVAKYQKAIELYPKSADAYAGWGYALYGQKNYAGAVAKYQKAIELDPKSAPAYNNWGLALEKLGRHAEAEEKFTRARELLSSQ